MKKMTVLCALVMAGGPWLTSTSAQGLPIDGPALGTNRITQAQIINGGMSLKEIRRKGMEIFATPFNLHDGRGDGPVNANDPLSPGGRPTINGTVLRINGLDSQACNDCHNVLSNRTIPGTFTVGGVGGVTQTAFPGIWQFDIADEDADGIANINGRSINPPFVFGSGGVELIAKEMTVDLQNIKDQAMANPGIRFPLITKGVDFGEIFYSRAMGFDTSLVVGVDPDLVVQPFGRKGNNSTIREFDIGALQFHQGMQPEEIFGTGVDADGDGVADEILVGELSAMHLFSVNSDRPVRVGVDNANVQAGESVFLSAGCAVCHIPTLNTATSMLPVAFPEVETDPSANVFMQVDLANGRANFKPNGSGGVAVNMYSDLKRHHMGTELSETTGDALDPFFVTPRLWGVADTSPYLHDGRAFTLREAVELHGGDGQSAADNFANLTPNDQDKLLIFLNSLRVPRNPNGDLSQQILPTMVLATK